MKPYLKFSFLFALLFTQFIVQAQDDEVRILGDLPHKYRAVTLGFGTRGLSTTPGTIVTSLIDDSPSMDSFSGTKEIDDFKGRLGMQVGYHFGKYRGMSHSFFFDGAFGEIGTFYFGYSIGWNFPIKLKYRYLHLRAAVAGYVGNTRIKLGSINNNASYIQIGEKQFFDDEVKVKLESDNFLWKPHLEILYPFNDNFNFFGNIGYEMGGQSNVDMRFESKDGEITAEKAIDGDNPFVSFNGDKLEELPFDLGGLRFNVGIAYVWGKYLKGHKPLK